MTVWATELIVSQGTESIYLTSHLQLRNSDVSYFGDQNVVFRSQNNVLPHSFFKIEILSGVF